MKSILIARPENDAIEISSYLDSHDLYSFVEPLFVVEKLTFKNSFKKPEFIIISSANACYALLKLDLEKNIRIYAVGAKTAKKVANLGFTNVFFPKENSADALKNLILAEQNIGYGLYLRGSVITFDFADKLKINGFIVENIIVYRIIENISFSTKLLDFCQNNHFDSVLIFSSNSAKIFCNLARKHNLLEYFNQSQILCFSKKIMNDIKNSGFKNAETFLASPVLKKFYD